MGDPRRPLLGRQEHVEGGDTVGLGRGNAESLGNVVEAAGTDPADRTLQRLQGGEQEVAVRRCGGVPAERNVAVERRPSPTIPRRLRRSEQCIDGCTLVFCSGRRHQMQVDGALPRTFARQITSRRAAVQATTSVPRRPLPVSGGSAVVEARFVEPFLGRGNHSAHRSRGEPHGVRRRRRLRRSSTAARWKPSASESPVLRPTRADMSISRRDSQRRCRGGSRDCASDRARRSGATAYDPPNGRRSWSAPRSPARRAE